MIWTDQQVEVLTAQWMAGITSSEIASTIGCSAEAIRAKRAHLGLPSRAGPVAQEAMQQAGRNRRSARPAAPVGEAEPAKLAPLAGSTPRPWLSRTFGECAFPVGGEGAETLSCCLKVARERGAYCMGHLTIMGANS